jgi:hypothetical protein
LVRAGLSRKEAAFTLWTLSGIYATFAVFISRPNLAIENYLVVAAGLLWALLFVLFFKTEDT